LNNKFTEISDLRKQKLGRKRWKNTPNEGNKNGDLTKASGRAAEESKSEGDG